MFTLLRWLSFAAGRRDDSTTGTVVRLEESVRYFPWTGLAIKILDWNWVSKSATLQYGFIKNALATVIYNISNNFIFRNSNRVLWFPMRIMGLATLSIMSRGNYSVARDSHTSSRHSTLLLILLLSCRQTTTAGRVRLTAQKCRQSLDGNKAEEISSTFQSGRS